MYKAFLSLRYLRTRYIALASIVSVMLGVATMVVVNSVMKGFTSEMRSRIKGLLSDIVIETNSLDGREGARQHFELVRSVVGDKIAGMTATVEVWGLMSFQFHGQYMTRPITLIGIEPEGKSKVGPLKEYLESYRTVVENGVLVRAPLRDKSVPAGWELTAQAKAFRKEVVDRRKWLDESLQDLNNPPGQKKAPAGPQVMQAGHTSPPGGRPGGPAPSENTGPRTPDAQVAKSSATAPPSQDPDDLFSHRIELPPTVQPAHPIDPAAPMDARVYVGAGLIRYPYEDPKTGKVHMIDMVSPGDDVTISTVTAGRPPNPVHFGATIVDVFKCGMSEYDSNLVFCNLSELQHERAMIDPDHENDPDHKAITSIQIKLKPSVDSREVIERLQAVFPPGLYTIKTWEQKQGPLLQAVEIETGILNVLLFLIIAVAGFGILAIFFMIVVEKTRDIGVLKALGASSGGVMSIFLSYGLALGVVGSGVGVILGLIFVRYINQIESVVAMITGHKVFDDKVYYFPTIPTRVEPGMIAWITIGAIAIAIMASVLPARRAARLRPVESLRYE
jgi:lipoprotein-releasing system permease protein